MSRDYYNYSTPDPREEEQVNVPEPAPVEAPQPPPAEAPPVEPSPAGPRLTLPGEETPAGLPRMPVRKHRYRRPEEKADPVRSEVDEAALLNVVLQSVQRRQQGGEPTRSTRPAINRFVARAEPANAAEQAVAPEKGAQTPKAAAEPVMPKFRPSTFGEPANAGEHPGRRWLLGLLALALVAAVALVAYFAGRNDASQITASVEAKAPQPAVNELWLPTFADDLNKALIADHAGDLTQALRLSDALKKRMGLNPVLEAYRATLRTRQGYTSDVEADLTGWLGPNTSPQVTATINAARGFNFVRRRQFDEALECFASVAQISPFDVPNLVHWGETLRRNGNLPAAAEKYQEALTRLPANSLPAEEAQREYIAYEWRLSLIENGRQAELQLEIEQHLGAPDPAGYWLLTTAAAALQNEDIPSAVDALKKAKEAIPPEQFNGLLSDYFFRSYSSHLELDAFLVSLPPQQQQARKASMDYFIDP